MIILKIILGIIILVASLAALAFTVWGVGYLTNTLMKEDTDDVLENCTAGAVVLFLFAILSMIGYLIGDSLVG